MNGTSLSLLLVLAILSTIAPTSNSFLYGFGAKILLNGKKSSPYQHQFPRRFCSKLLASTSSPPLIDGPKGPGYLLNNLFTGFPLNGVVVSSTEYATFVDCHVYRYGPKQSLAPVNGMLHISDTNCSIAGVRRPAFELFRIGTPISAFVKGVTVNSG